MEALSIVLILITFIMAAGIIFMIILYVRQGSTLINSSNCPKTEGSYGLQPGTVYILPSATGILGNIAALSSCGSSGTDVCESQATNMTEATNYCDTYYSICNAFIYSAATQTVIIVDTTQTLSTNTVYDLYTRQYPKTTT